MSDRTTNDHSYPAVCPRIWAIEEPAQGVGFCPSPNGSGIRVWWAADSSPIGWESSVADAVATGLCALREVAETEGWHRTVALVDNIDMRDELERIETALTTTDWYSLGW